MKIKNKLLTAFATSLLFVTGCTNKQKELQAERNHQAAKFASNFMEVAVTSNFTVDVDNTDTYQLFKEMAESETNESKDFKIEVFIANGASDDFIINLVPKNGKGPVGSAYIAGQ